MIVKNTGQREEDLMTTFSYYRIRHLREVTNFNEVNELLRDGWFLLGFYHQTERPIVYVMARLGEDSQARSAGA